VLVWTVKDLTADERDRLAASAQGFLPKGESRGSALVHALNEHLALRSARSRARREA
jgi:hypothetical protein